MTLRETQAKIANDVVEYLNNTAKCNRAKGKGDYCVYGITMDDILLAIQTSDVGDFISDYAHQEN